MAHPAAPHPAEHRAAAHRAGDLYLRFGDHRRGDPLLPRRRHAAERAELGKRHRRGPHALPGRGVHRHRAEHLPVAHGARRQSHRRRAARRARSAAGEAHVILEVDNLQTHFFTRDGVVRAVDGVSYRLAKGETLGVVGESGCGKSIGALSILRLVPPPGRIVGGAIRYEGRNLLELSEAEMRDLRGNRISMIFQEPMTSLNPVLTIGRQIAETVKLHQGLSSAAATGRAVEMMRLVHIPEAETRLRQYPHELSGGMRQRVMIAMALACNPQVLIADEPTTALDVTIQAQILDLIGELKEKLGTAVILITHDLGVVAETAQRVVVLYAGRKVEEAPVEELFDSPLHPYTQGLMAAIPKLAQGARRLNEIPGSVQHAAVGCSFAARCPRASEQCRVESPALTEPRAGHFVACWHA